MVFEKVARAYLLNMGKWGVQRRTVKVAHRTARVFPILVKLSLVFFVQSFSSWFSWALSLHLFPFFQFWKVGFKSLWNREICGLMFFTFHFHFTFKKMIIFVFTFHNLRFCSQFSSFDSRFDYDIIRCQTPLRGFCCKLLIDSKVWPQPYLFLDCNFTN